MAMKRTTSNEDFLIVDLDTGTILSASNCVAVFSKGTDDLTDDQITSLADEKHFDLFVDPTVICGSRA